MGLHKPFWGVIPVLMFSASWGFASTSNDAANQLVEIGLLSPRDASLFVLPGARGAGLGAFNLLLYVGIMIVVGAAISLLQALNYIWDEEKVPESMLKSSRKKPRPDDDADEDDEPCAKSQGKHSDKAGGREPSKAMKAFSEKMSLQRTESRKRKLTSGEVAAASKRK